MSLAPTDSEVAIGLPALGGVDGVAQFGQLPVDLALARTARFRRQAVAGALRAEQPVGDGGAGAGQRQIGDRDVRILHGERQRGARLVAVQRAVAGRIEPERALPLPDGERIGRLARAPALIAGSARAVILRRCRAEIGAEAEAFIGQRDRSVRISFAGSDAVAEAGNENVAHRDFGRGALVAFCARNIDGCNRGAAIANPQVDRFGAVERRGLRAVAVVERPGAGGANRNRAGQTNRDRMIDRREIAFLDVVAGAGLADAAGEIDAEPVHGVARPATAIALYRQRLFGGKHAAAATGLRVQHEIPFLAEQPETVAHFPRNLQRPVAAGGLGFRCGRGEPDQRAGEQRDCYQ
jgi:hypothetical protein